ncbi:hypothetical protein [Cylindrospermopsis raciborskii]|nr:hypothetical protein [Cylindrospermopsis raciborskii]
MNLLLGMSDGIGRRLRSTPYGISPVKKINLPYPNVDQSFVAVHD